MALIDVVRILPFKSLEIECQSKIIILYSSSYDQ